LCLRSRGQGSSRGGERRAQEILERKEEMTQTESGPRQNGSNSVRREEAKIVSDGRMRGEYRPRELRIKLYDRVMALRQLGLSYNKIRHVIKQEYGIELSKCQISGWVRGLHSPYNRGRIPSLELLEPSEDLAYVIGAVCGDGYVGLKRHCKDYTLTIIHLRAKDKEFVEEFAIRIGRVLNRPPPKPKVKRSTGRYYIKVESKTLYELLKKPVDLERLRKYIEHCDKCIAAFLRGFFDAEGSISENGPIHLVNSDYRLLKYMQSLLERFEIVTAGPHLQHQQGSIMHIKGKQYVRRRDVYYIHVKRSCNMGFYKHIGFTIKKKQERLVNYLRRTGRLE
jgi:intein-encoded DNA endonuclease-like protein